MKKKIFFLVLFFVTVFFSYQAHATACTSTSLTDLCTVDTNLQLNNSQTFYVNSTTGIVLGASTGNFVLDCNYSTIIGNGSGTLFTTNFKTNITIKNCNVYNAGIAFYVNRQNVTIMNNNVTSNYTSVSEPDIYGAFIVGNSADGANVSNNLMIFPVRNVTSASAGIKTSNTVTGVIANNNNITGSKYGIAFTTGTTFSNITNNFIYNPGFYGVDLAGTNLSATGNYVYNSSWNSIHFFNFSETIANNIIRNFVHHGIDIHNDGTGTVGGNALIYNNTITQDAGYQCPGTAIFIDSAKNVSVYNNNLSGLVNGTFTDNLSGCGIAFEGGDYGSGNTAYNNVLNMIQGIAFYDDSNNTIWTNNTVSNAYSAYSANVFGSYKFTTNISMPTFINNTDLSRTFTFLFSDNRTNLTLYTASTNVNISNVNRNGNGINLYPVFPYNDVWNGSTLLYNNSGNINFTLVNGVKINIGDIYCNKNVPLFSIKYTMYNDGSISMPGSTCSNYTNQRT